ncbi:similar to Saccharomyces cerevisiae YMR194C-B CMC4 Protein that localizes to the mitochondrial intermembrane space via the Mia40p-Erv1p system [Geotrichum candidum]|uniref:Cx9C motif-containing protein 4, mitochondrial n=1 Tax=Geotrichum candidum TaxID=1173061 RepID=A0A0J9X5H2_GEOCN|nr:similar to Saccharomyces cerevisiae YMR194C-B CMC4 Protein that localizes to the mitochondrial intermembrane space via the Mia40p-Erv1p system [Geotrichum candidum]
MSANDEQTPEFYSKQPCHAQACAIQGCLKKSNYNEARCTKAIDALYACCLDFYNANPPGAKTVSCPYPELLDLKIKQRLEDPNVDAKLHRHYKAK